MSLGETWIDLIARYRQKSNQVIKMSSDEDFIPRSARIADFKFFVPKEVETSEEFNAIKEATDNIVTTFKKDLKKRSQVLLCVKNNLIVSG